MNFTNCLICGGDKFEHIMTINHKCLNCGHIFIDGPKDLDKYYNQIYRKGSPLPSEDKRKVFLNNILDRIKKVVNLKDKYILEVGAADGFMSQIISDRFTIPKVQLNCCELDETLANHCRNRGFRTLNYNMMNILNVNYDIVFAIDILEHIEAIDKVKDWLKQFKYGIIQLPRARGPKVSFKAHFQTFSDKSLEKFLEGFKILGRWDTNEGETCFGKAYLVVIENVNS